MDSICMDAFINVRLRAYPILAIGLICMHILHKMDEPVTLSSSYDPD